METVVFVHGYASGSVSWELVAPLIVKNKYDTKFVDLLGCGDIPPPEDFGYTLEEQARYLENEISQIDGDVILVAHSMGAAVAIISILDLGIKPIKLILVDPLLYPQPKPFFVKVQTIPLISIAISWLVPPSFQVDLVLRRIFFRFKNVNPQMRRNYIAAFKKPFHRKVLRETAVQLNKFDGSHYINRFSEIDTQTDVIWSKEDPLIDFAKSARFEKEIQNCSIFPIEECGHAPQEECPERFAALLNNILNMEKK